jgi:hypothetical protein
MEQPSSAYAIGEAVRGLGYVRNGIAAEGSG